MTGSFQLIAVLFSGYLVFARRNAIWDSLPDDWGVYLVPWMTLVAYVLVFIILLKKNAWKLDFVDPEKANISDGACMPDENEAIGNASGTSEGDLVNRMATGVSTAWFWTLDKV